MENMQSLPNQQSTEALVQQQVGPNNSKLFVVVVASILFTGIVTGSIVYFWQKSQIEREISGFQQKISSLERQLSSIKKRDATPWSAPSLILSPPLTPITKPTANLKTYSNEKYRFSFNYPQNWKIDDVYQNPDAPISLSNIANGHTISVHVYPVTGFGYCYKYGESKTIVVGGKTAKTADGVGVGGTEMCDEPEKYANRGNTFVLIPIDDNDTTYSRIQIHISYDYPLDDIDLAKSNLNQVLSTFKFTN